MLIKPVKNENGIGVHLRIQVKIRSESGNVDGVASKRKRD